MPRLSPRARRSNLSAGEGSNALESWFWGSAQNSGTPWRWPCDPEEHNRRHSRDDAGDPGQRFSWGNRDPAHHQYSATSAYLYTVDKEGDVTTSCALYNWRRVTIMNPAPLKKYHLKSSGEKVAASTAVGRLDQRWRRGWGPPTLPSVDTVQYMLPRNTNTVSFWSKCRLKGENRLLVLDWYRFSRFREPFQVPITDEHNNKTSMSISPIVMASKTPWQ